MADPKSRAAANARKRKRSNSLPANPQKAAVDRGTTEAPKPLDGPQTGGNVSSPHSATSIARVQPSSNDREPGTDTGESRATSAAASSATPEHDEPSAPRLPRKRRNTFSGIGQNEEQPEVDVDGLLSARRKKQGADDTEDVRGPLSEPAEPEDGPEPKVDHVGINTGDRKRKTDAASSSSADEEPDDDVEPITVARQAEESDEKSKKKKPQAKSADGAPDDDASDSDSDDDDEDGVTVVGSDGTKAKKKKKKQGGDEEKDVADPSAERPLLSENDRRQIDALRDDYRISDKDIEALETQVKKVRSEGVNWEMAMKLFGDDPDFQEIFEDRMKRPVDAEESEGKADRFLASVKSGITAANAIKTAVKSVPIVGPAMGVAEAVMKRSTAKDKKRVTRVLANLESNPIVRAISGPLYAKHRKEQLSATVNAAGGVVSTAQGIGGHVTSVPLTLSGAAGSLIAGASEKASGAVGGGVAGLAAEQVVSQVGKIPDKLAKLGVKEGVPKLDSKITGISSTGTERTRAFLEFLGMKSRVPLLEEKKGTLSKTVKGQQVMKELLRLEIRRSMGMTDDNEDLLDRVSYKKDRETTKAAINAVRLPGSVGELQDKLTELSKKQEFLAGTDRELQAYDKLKKVTKSKSKLIEKKEAELSGLRTQIIPMGAQGGATVVRAEPEDEATRKKIKDLETEIENIKKAEAKELEDDLQGTNMLAFLFKTEGLFLDGENRFRKTKGFRRLLDEKVGYKANIKLLDRESPIQKAIEVKQAEYNSLVETSVVAGVRGGVSIQTIPKEKQAKAAELSEEISALKAQLKREKEGTNVLKQQLKKEISGTKRDVLTRQIEQKQLERERDRLVKYAEPVGPFRGVLVDVTSPENRAKIEALDKEIKQLEQQRTADKEQYAFPKRK